MAEDVTAPNYLTDPQPYGIRSARILSGRGQFSPGYRLRGEGSGAPTEAYATVNIRKVVNPLGGQGPVRNPLFYRRDAGVINVNRLRQQRSVAVNQFGTSKVVRPPQTAVRRMTGNGQGVVGYA